MVILLRRQDENAPSAVVGGVLGNKLVREKIFLCLLQNYFRRKLTWNDFASMGAGAWKWATRNFSMADGDVKMANPVQVATSALENECLSVFALDDCALIYKLREVCCSGFVRGFRSTDFFRSLCNFMTSADRLSDWQPNNSWNDDYDDRCKIFRALGLLISNGRLRMDMTGLFLPFYLTFGGALPRMFKFCAACATQFVNAVRYHDIGDECNWFRLAPEFLHNYAFEVAKKGRVNICTPATCCSTNYTYRRQPARDVSVNWPDEVAQLLNSYVSQ